MSDKIYKYKFSVVIPIYNVENYLNETIESIITQTIGFRDNIQIIFVNDGSPDDSEKICKVYEAEYPNNIIYIKQKNSGVSSARNNGKKYIEGKYVCFLDSDDKWEKHAFERVWHFFEKYERDIDIVDCRVKYFDGDDKYYIYDSRYTSSRIVDANKEYSLTLLNTATTFLKTSAIKNVTFDENLKYSEDTKFINEVLLKKCKYGIKHDALYLYRKRQSGDSAVDKRLNEKSYFLDPPKYCFKELIDKSLKKNKKVARFLQYLIISNVLWRMKISDSKKILTFDENKKYTGSIIEMLKYVEDDMILERNTSLNNIIYILGLKYNEDLWDELKLDKNSFCLKGSLIKSDSLFENATFSKMRIFDNKLIIHGKLNSICTNENFDFYAKDTDSNTIYKAEIQNIKKWNVISFDDKYISRGYLFRLEIPLEQNIRTLRFVISLKGKGEFNIKFKVKAILGLSKNYYSYKKYGNYLIALSHNSIKIEKYNLSNHFINWIKRTIDLIKKLKIKTLLKHFIKNITPIFVKIKSKLRLKNIIIMESNPAFSDNTKIVFDKLIEKGVNKKYKIVWFVDKMEPFQDIKIENVEFIKYFDPDNPKFKKSKYAIYCHNRAKIIIDNNRFLQKRNPYQIRIHLVHGSPIKNAAEYNLRVGELDYLVSQSKFFVPMDSKIRDINIDKIKPVGFARNDIIYKVQDFSFDKFDKASGMKKILWLPTYRNHKAFNNNKNSLKYGLACIDNKQELINLNKKLMQENVVLFIKFHPAEDASILESFNLANIVIINDDELKQANIVLYQLFSRVDALITDFSSVYFDFSLTKKNVGLAISDIDEYVKNQGDFQYKYKDIVVGNYMYNNEDLLQFVDDVSKGIDRTYKQRMKAAKRYDDYCDGKSADRIYEIIKKHL